MALDLGTLRIALELDKGNLGRGLADARREIETLPPAVQREMVKVGREMDAGGRKAGQLFGTGLVRDASGRLRNARGQFASDAEVALAGLDPVAERKGKDTGGVLAKGINAGLIRNSPLIVAGVSAALAAGAPLVTAGAGILFGGVGAVAAAQTLEVRQAWTQLGRDIRDDAVDDAAVLVPVYTEMAGQIGDAFQDLRPELRAAFADTAPLIRSTTDGIIALARNAMPGLVRAVQNGQPVFTGLESFLGTVGTGVGEFFSIISGHAPAAGTAFAALGDIVGDLLPVLGELLGQGAELASVVLPPLAAVMGTVADAAEDLGPLLPMIATGLIAMKAAGAVTVGVSALSGALTQVAQNAAFASYSMEGVGGAAAGRLAEGTSRASRALGAMSSALPVVGAGLAILTAAYARNEQNVREWSQALLDGGKAAEQALAAASQEEITADIAGSMTGLGAVFDFFTTDVQEAKAASDELYASMTDGQRAQQDATRAQNELTAVLDDFPPSSDEAKAAAARYEAAQARVAEQSDRTQLAVHGVTQAMIDQANQALAAIDSSFAYRNSTDQLEDAQTALTETVKNLTAEDENLRTTQEDVERAQLAVEEQAYRTALAYGQQKADMSGLKEGTSEYQRMIQTETLRELERLRDAAGPEMKGAIQTQIDALLLSGVHLDETGRKTDTAAGKANGFRDAVNGIPASKQTTITADTGPATAEIDKLMARLRSEGALTVSRAATAQNAFRQLGGAIGGIVHAYADGGFEPMKGGIAQVVAPNTWRVIGDRVADDEAYIPINSSQRSQEILEQTADRMGYGLAPKDLRYFAEGGIADRYMLPVELTSGTRTDLERALAAKYNVPGSGGALGSGYMSLFNTGRAAFPGVVLTSGYRPGDPGYHGLGRAADLGWAGNNRAKLAEMQQWWYANHGAQLAELIGPIDSLNIKNGRPHRYNASTLADHEDHDHVARRNGGRVWPGQEFLVGEEGAELVRFAGNGEVIGANQTRQMLAHRSAAAPAVASASPTGAAVASQVTRIEVDARGMGADAIARAIERRQQQRDALASRRG